MIAMYKMMLVSITFLTMMKNPISMGMNLLMFTTLTTMMINKMLVNSWFSMITFLMMIGGLLIIFSYMSSIASNEMFSMKMNITLMVTIMLIISDEMMEKMIMKDELCLNSFEEMELMSLIKLYNKKSMAISIMLVMLLLISMISISKTVKHHMGPLRSK